MMLLTNQWWILNSCIGLLLFFSLFLLQVWLVLIQNAVLARRRGSSKQCLHGGTRTGPRWIKSLLWDSDLMAVWVTWSKIGVGLLSHLLIKSNADQSFRGESDLSLNSPVHTEVSWKGVITPTMTSQLRVNSGNMVLGSVCTFRGKSKICVADPKSEIMLKISAQSFLSVSGLSCQMRSRTVKYK